MAIALHWAVGAALLGEMAFGYLLDDIAARGTPARGAVINLHKTLGLYIGFLIIFRLAWRLAHAPPPLPAATPRWERRAARVGQALMYVGMLVLPLSGYIASNFSKHGVRLFGVALRPWGPDLPAVYAVFNNIHVFGSWLFTALVVGHVLASLKHFLIDRDGVMQAMWPRLRRYRTTR